MTGHGQGSAGGRLVHGALRRGRHPGWTSWPARRDYRPDVLLDVQRALLRMCAARGDLLAVLSVPEHYRADQVARHVQRSPSRANAPEPDELVTPLGAWETPVLGYGALYHPWLVHGALDADAPTSTSAPDGAVAGRDRRPRPRRGAPGSRRPTRSCTTRRAGPRRAARRPEGCCEARRPTSRVRSRDEFLWLSEDTLAADPDWRPVSVRRLLSLLRRVVLLEGPHYVFEPNDPRPAPRDRARVRRADAVPLRARRLRGRTPSGGVPGRRSAPVEHPGQRRRWAGWSWRSRFAPSRPLEFLRVRLVHAGEPGFRLVDA